MMSFLQKLLLMVSVSLTAVTMSAVAAGFDTNYVELDKSKLIETSGSNYAILSNDLPSNWRAVSINGGQMKIIGRDNHVSEQSYENLSHSQKDDIQRIKNTLEDVIKFGPYNIKPTRSVARLTTFDRFGGSSSMGTGGGSSSSSSSSSSSGAGGSMSMQSTGPNSFIVSKQDFPFEWMRLFVDSDLITVVYKSGTVVMRPESALKPEEKKELEKLRNSRAQSQKAAEQLTHQMTSSFNPMDFVNRAMGGIFGGKR